MKKDFVSLADERPDLAKEWNYEKNGDLKPEDVSCGSNKKVWWKLPYDVPDDYTVEHLRGKHFEFEWQATTNNRTRGKGNCPYLCGQAIWKGFNDLQSVNPKLAKQWHPVKNKGLKPTCVNANSTLKVWWLLQYDIPMDYHIECLRGKHFDFEWQATVQNRNSRKWECPFLSGRAVWNGFNDLQTVNPELAKQWHPTKNGNLTPTQVSSCSDKKVWWMFSYDVPMDYSVKCLRGKHFDFEWQTSISNRNKNGLQCPFLNGRAVWRGFNDLQTVNPELAKQWHPVKNGNLKPTQFTANAGKKVWWLLSYDVPMNYPVECLRGKHFDFEWQSTIYRRNNGNGCPFLSGSSTWTGFNDLETVNPKLAEQWHPTKNGNLKPTQIFANSNKKVWWLLPYDIPIDYPIEQLRGKHFNFEWQASVYGRNLKNFGCPFLSGKAVWPGFNDLQTVSPELTKEWNYVKNGCLKPIHVTATSNQKVWWILPYDVPIDYPVKQLRGRHFDFEWQATIGKRYYYKNNCPYLSNHSVWLGFNDLQTVSPELAEQWHPIKNGNLKPTDVMAGSNQKVWWFLPYDDPITGKHFDFEWKSSIISRTNKECGCPFLSSQALWKGFNDLQTVNSELAKQWHPTKNGNLKPTDVMASSNQKVWWFLPYDDSATGKHFNFEWMATINSRNQGCGCPFLNGLTPWKGFNDLQTVSPELAKQWHPTKNGNLKPTDVMAGSNQKVWWFLPYDDPITGKHFDFEWTAIISNRYSKKHNCPYLSGHAVWKGFNDLQTMNPELAKQWHHTKNGNLKPTKVTAGSGKKVWWLLPYDDQNTGKHFDFEWQATIYNRNKGVGCPYLITYKGEEYIKQYLQKNNIVFNAQQKFSDLLGTGDGQLSYDFSIPNEKYEYVLIEYNGIQHYEANDYFGGEEKFKIQKEHDKRKRDYAKKHGYKLITVKYTYDTYESVEEYLDKELKKLGVINDTKKEENVNDAA